MQSARCFDDEQHTHGASHWPTKEVAPASTDLFPAESRMLSAAAWEVFECLFILAVLIGAVAGVAIYSTLWLMLLPLRLATAPRGQGGDVQPLQDCGLGPCSMPAIHSLRKAA